MKKQIRKSLQSFSVYDITDKTKSEIIEYFQDLDIDENAKLKIDINSYDGHEDDSAFYITREETDDEYMQRINSEMRFKMQQEQRDRETYLRLKEKFND